MNTSLVICLHFRTWCAHAAIYFLAFETRVTLCLTTLMLLRTLSYSKWSCGMLVSHSVCGWCSGSNRSCGWSRLMVGRWSFQSLYCCSSSLLVRACRFLPTEQRISLHARLLACEGHCRCFFLSLLCISFPHTLLFFTFPPLELRCGVSTKYLKCLQTPKSSLPRSSNRSGRKPRRILPGHSKRRPRLNPVVSSSYFFFF